MGGLWGRICARPSGRLGAEASRCHYFTMPSSKASEKTDAVGRAGVLTGDGACVVGVSDLFLRRPASCDDSSGWSGGGDPDIGGEGREAQTGVGMGLDKLRFSENREGSLSNLCLLNEGGIGGTPASLKECMRVADNSEATQGYDKIWRERIKVRE